MKSEKLRFLHFSTFISSQFPLEKCNIGYRAADKFNKMFGNRDAKLTTMRRNEIPVLKRKTFVRGRAVSFQDYRKISFFEYMNFQWELCVVGRSKRLISTLHKYVLCNRSFRSLRVGNSTAISPVERFNLKATGANSHSWRDIYERNHAAPFD